MVDRKVTRRVDQGLMEFPDEAAADDDYAELFSMLEDAPADEPTAPRMSLASADLRRAAQSSADWVQVFVDTIVANLSSYIPGPFGIGVGDASGALVAAKTRSYDIHRAEMLGSAAKWHAGIVFIALIEDGLVDYDGLASKYLDFWTTDARDPRSQVRVRHLLQFTSGFGSYRGRFHYGCIGEPAFTFLSCARKIYTEAYGGAQPGARFWYDHTHTEIMAAIAEQVTSKPWRQLYQERVADKLGIGTSANGTGGWGYDHPDVGRVLHLSAADNARFLAGLLSTMQGKGPLLATGLAVERFLAPGASVCRDASGAAVSHEPRCRGEGWLADKVTYAATHIVGVDASRRVYDASPGYLGFWPELVLPQRNAALPAAVPGGFWWELAIALPSSRERFLTWRRVAEAVRGLLFQLLGVYQRSWGLLEGELPEGPCAWPPFCRCAPSGAHPKHPLSQLACHEGLRESCLSAEPGKALRNEVCADARAGAPALWASPRLNRPRLQRSLHGACGPNACSWGAWRRVAGRGCPALGGADSCSNRTATAAVRCCSAGGRGVPMQAGPRAYGCHSGKTFAEAALLCSSWGLRLCSKSELSRSCGSGCGFDAASVWTSSGC